MLEWAHFSLKQISQQSGPEIESFVWNVFNMPGPGFDYLIYMSWWVRHTTTLILPERQS